MILYLVVRGESLDSPLIEGGAHLKLDAAAATHRENPGTKVVAQLDSGKRRELNKTERKKIGAA